MGDVPIDGECDPRFARVREAFTANFHDHDEIGAALCIRLGDRTVVDLWGGFADAERTRPWQRGTLVNVYSVGKGILALLVLACAERGDLRLDEPVAARWPAFAAGDKGAVTLRELLAHRAGLPSVRERLPAGAMLDWGRMCEALAAQTPWWPPGTAHGYHVNTFGFLVGEVVRRATGKRVGEALRETLTGPLEADFHYGLPAARHAEVAVVVAPQRTLEGEEQWALAFPPTGDRERDTMVWHAYFNPPGLSGFGSVNTPGWRLAEIPSTNGHGTARAVAALYALALSHRPPAPGPGLLAEATTIHSDGDDRVLGRPTRFGLGFQLPSPDRPLGPSPRAFGHYGYGGSLGFADPEAGLAFGYLMNRPGDRWRTPRTLRLIEAVYACLG
ncbi:MAG TPA: class A beta-lactamase-related serine hydrolase [Alphaproteobacteria bacterium]|nr:class A beta-lactamase-related serine hydrolase [Alphaproteobacteria bacterium]